MGRIARRALAAAVLVLVLGGGFLFVRSALFGSVPPMSLVPALPGDAAIVRNETEYSDGAGGNSARVLLLRSTGQTPAQLASAVAEVFDADPAWHHDANGSSALPQGWQLEPVSCDGTRPRTSASVSVVASGEEVGVGQFDSFVADAPAVVLRISTLDHPFCDVGPFIR